MGVVQNDRPLTRLKAIIAAGGDVNWRNDLGFPVIYYAAQLRNYELFKMLADAGASLQVLARNYSWSEQNPEIIYAHFLQTQPVQTSLGTFTVAELNAGAPVVPVPPL